jgi:hypothetical protein
MLKNFEKTTHELTPFELECVDFLGQWFMTNTGRKNTLKNQDISKMVEAKFGKKLPPPRVRKIIQALRTNGLPNLIASGRGYFYANETKEIENWVISLKQREAAIRTIREKAERQVEIMNFSKYARKQMEIF